MKITPLGHAGLYIETSDQRLFVDPLFTDQLVGGAIEVSPGREFDFERMPQPTALVLTHGHFDHFNRDSVARFPRGTPIFTSRDARVLKALAELKFSEIYLLDPWESVRLGQTTVMATPSDHHEPEFGVWVGDASGSFWHMVDSDVTKDVAERIVRDHGRVDVVAVKYQPIALTSMSHFRSLGNRVPKEVIFETFETACAAGPRFAFPYAFGVKFGGRHGWLNRYALAMSPPEAAALLAARLGAEDRAGTVRPGDVITIEAGRPIERASGASTFVKPIDAEAPIWEPTDVDSLLGVERSERPALAQKIDRVIAEEMMPFLRENLGGKYRHLPEYGVVWQLAVHAGDGERFIYSIDFRRETLAFVRGPNPGANFFVHVSGRTALDVIDGRQPELLFWLTGEARAYEKIMQVRDGAFWKPPVEGWDLFAQVLDPFTGYLRVHPPVVGP